MVIVLVFNAVRVRQFLILLKHQVAIIKSIIVLSILYIMQ